MYCFRFSKADESGFPMHGVMLSIQVPDFFSAQIFALIHCFYSFRLQRIFGIFLMQFKALRWNQRKIQYCTARISFWNISRECAFPSSISKLTYISIQKCSHNFQNMYGRARPILCRWKHAYIPALQIYSIFQCIYTAFPLSYAHENADSPYFSDFCRSF